MDCFGAVEGGACNVAIIFNVVVAQPLAMSYVGRQMLRSFLMNVSE